jgi:lipid-binding SYLF domain-containing protein
MNRIHRRTAIAGAVAACALAFSAAPASAAPNTATNTAPNTATNTYANTTTHATRASSDDLQDANQHVKQALDVVRKMDSDPHIKTLLKQSLGVFVVPDYGRASFVVGGQGGAGVLLTQRNGRWGGPAFYNLGGVSLGAQAGVSGGHIAMVLMDQKALDSFGQNNKFSLNADAGLTIIDASARGHATAGHAMS